jgi:sugar phosphate isomerase/epimerase
MEVGLCMWSFTNVHSEAGTDPDPFSAIGLAELAVARGLRAVEVSGAELDGQSGAEEERFGAVLKDGDLALVVDTGAKETPSETGAGVEGALRTAAARQGTVVRTTISRCLEGDRSQYGYAGWKEHLRALVDPLKRATARAADVGIPVGIENHQDICSWELLWLTEQVGSPWLGVVLDCGNAYAVGEEPSAFAERVMPILKHVHFKDYVVHPTPSGWRLVRCPIGSGVVDFADLITRFERGAPGIIGCIELGASSARHVRCLEADWWRTYDERPWESKLAALRDLHAREQPAGEEWRTPHERGEPAAEIATYELQQFESSVTYLKNLLSPAA